MIDPVKTSVFVAKMQAALDKRRRAKTQLERDEAIKEMADIIRGAPERQMPDHKAKAAGRESED